MPIENDERVRQYDDRLRSLHSFDRWEHDARVSKGMQRRAEIVRFPIPRHRALVPVSKVKRHKVRRAQP